MSESFRSRNQEIPGHLALCEARLQGLGAVHIDAQFGLVEGLLDAQIGNPCDGTQLLHQRVGKLVIRVDIAPTIWMSIGAAGRSSGFG